MNFKFQTKRYFNHMFLIPPETYIENLKKIYLKYGNSKVKTLKEFKRLALAEAKKVSQVMGKLSKESRLEVILSKDIVIQVLQSTYDSLNSLFVRINHNYKNERRSVYDNSEEYMEIIRKYEVNKVKLFKYTIKNVCKQVKIAFASLQRSVFHYLEQKDSNVIDLINKASQIGRHFAIAPNCLTKEDIKDILEKYYHNLNYIISNEKDSDISKYATIILCDIIYEYFGLEEEQVFSSIQERVDLKNDNEISKLLVLINDLVGNNLNVIYEL